MVKTKTVGNFAATPLSLLNAVALDTETTGLDVSSARIIQIGAVKIYHGELHADDAFDTLIDPGTAIPPKSTAIHGIHDRDVQGKCSFAETKAQLDLWIGESVVVGYAIGFDFAIFSREHKLADLEWVAPRSIDIRYLSQFVAPQLPDYSLELIAEWLQVEIEGRHTALGDAITAGNIFLGLIPHLEQKGIHTLAQAKRVCRTLSEQITAEAQLGWHSVARSSLAPGSELAALARIDSFPYRHRVADLMCHPPIFVNGDENLRDVLAIIMRQEISSVFVRPTEDGKPLGIVTERDILRTIDTSSDKALKLPVVQIAHYPLESIAHDAFVYRAIGRMLRKQFRHLGVHNETGKIVGAISARDLLRQRGDDAVSLGDAIEEATSVEGLKLIWSNIAMVTRGLVNEEVDCRDIAAVVSHELCALTRRACQIAEQEMMDRGAGSPPVAYAMLVLGSAGRGESLLAMDQDNAIVFSRGQAEGPEDQWFAQLGSRIAEILDAAGVPYCKGGVMAKNAEWRLSVDDWKAQISTWITRHKPQDILNTDIFFDAVAVHGDQALMKTITDFAFEVGGQSSDYLKLMSMNSADFKVPLGLFNKFRLHDGRMDLKLGGIMPIFSGARVQAIKYGIRDRSTRQRLTALKSGNKVPGEVIDKLVEAHGIIMKAILKQQLLDIEHGISLSNSVDPRSLPTLFRERLKRALELVPSVSDILGVP